MGLLFATIFFLGLTSLIYPWRNFDSAAARRMLHFPLYMLALYVVYEILIGPGDIRPDLGLLLPVMLASGICYAIKLTMLGSTEPPKPGKRKVSRTNTPPSARAKRLMREAGQL